MQSVNESQIVKDLAKALDVERGQDSARLYLVRLCRAALVFVQEYKAEKEAFQHQLSDHVARALLINQSVHAKEVDELNLEIDKLQERLQRRYDDFNKGYDKGRKEAVKDLQKELKRFIDNLDDE